LEGSRGVGESEEHNRWFEEAFGGKESRFPFVTLLDTYVVVSPPYVELGEEGAAGEAINGLRYKGGDVTVLLRPLVDRSIILDWTELPVFLFDKEEICSIGAPRFMDCSPLQMFSYKFLRFCNLALSQGKKSPR